MFPLVVSLIAAYIIGSLNFAIIISALVIHKDIREFGSGNAGSTNSVRVLGPAWGTLVFCLDFLKCALAMILAKYLIMPGISKFYLALVGIACIIGHLFPVFFKFKGGKGIACGAAMVLILDHRLFFIELFIFILVFIIFRYVSLSSIAAAVFFPIVSLLFGYAADETALFILFIIISLTLIFMHRKNIAKLISGKEEKFRFKKNK